MYDPIIISFLLRANQSPTIDKRSSVERTKRMSISLTFIVRTFDCFLSFTNHTTVISFFDLIIERKFFTDCIRRFANTLFDPRILLFWCDCIESLYGDKSRHIGWYHIFSRSVSLLKATPVQPQMKLLTSFSLRLLSNRSF